MFNIEENFTSFEKYVIQLLPRFSLILTKNLSKCDLHTFDNTTNPKTVLSANNTPSEFIPAGHLCIFTYNKLFILQRYTFAYPPTIYTLTIIFSQSHSIIPSSFFHCSITNCLVLYTLIYIYQMTIYFYCYHNVRVIIYRHVKF